MPNFRFNLQTFNWSGTEEEIKEVRSSNIAAVPSDVSLFNF